MRLNWLSILPILLVILVLAMGYIILTEPAGKPKISKLDALQIAKTCYPDMSIAESNATLGVYKIEAGERMVWSVDVWIMPDINSPNVYIAVVNAGDVAGRFVFPVHCANVAIDATTGEILHVNPVA